MNYITAKRTIVLRRFLGFALVILSAIVVVIGLLKFFYSSLDSSSPQLVLLAKLIKQLVYAIYTNTQIFAPIWNNSPIPNPKAPLSSSSIGFMLWYFGVFLGGSIIRSANRLAARLRRINEQIENQLIYDSMQISNRRTRVQIEETIPIPQYPIWKELHTLYIAPFVVGLLLLVLGKFFGLA